MNIFVGGLPFRMEEEALREEFARFGEVADARIIRDRQTGRSKGYGFVEMPDEAAELAIKELDGTELDGRTIVVNKAQDRPERPRGGFRRDNGYGGGR